MSDREYSKVRFEYDIWIDEGVSPWGSQIRIRTGSTHSWIWTGVDYLDDRGFFSSGKHAIDTNIHPYLGQYNGSQNNCIIPRQTWYTVHDIIDVDANTHIWNIIIGSNTYTYTLPYVSDYISFSIGNGDDHRTNYMGSMHFKIKNIKCYAVFRDNSEDLVFKETFNGNSLDLNIWKFYPIKSGVDNPIVSNNCLELSANCKGSINLLYSVLTNGTAYLTTYGPIPYQNKSSYLYCFSGKTPVNYPSFPYTNLQDLLDDCEPYPAEGTINIPSNYSFVNIYIVGGGGAGGIHCVENTNCGAGGGGSGYYKEYLGIPVNNKSIKVHVGAGGTRKWRERGVLEGNYKGNDGEESYVIIDDVKYAAAGGIGGGTGIFGCGGDGNIGGCAPACNCVPTNKLTNISTCIGTNQSSYKSSIHYWNIEKAKGASYIQQIKNEEYLLSLNGSISSTFSFHWNGNGEIYIIGGNGLFILQNRENGYNKHINGRLNITNDCVIGLNILSIFSYSGESNHYLYGTDTSSISDFHILIEDSSHTFYTYTNNDFIDGYINNAYRYNAFSETVLTCLYGMDELTVHPFRETCTLLTCEFEWNGNGEVWIGSIDDNTSPMITIHNDNKIFIKCNNNVVYSNEFVNGIISIPNKVLISEYCNSNTKNTISIGFRYGSKITDTKGIYLCSNEDCLSLNSTVVACLSNIIRKEINYTISKCNNTSSIFSFYWDGSGEIYIIGNNSFLVGKDFFNRTQTPINNELNITQYCNVGYNIFKTINNDSMHLYITNRSSILDYNVILKNLDTSVYFTYTNNDFIDGYINNAYRYCILDKIIRKCILEGNDTYRNYYEYYNKTTIEFEWDGQGDVWIGSIDDTPIITNGINCNYIRIQSDKDNTIVYFNQSENYVLEHQNKIYLTDYCDIGHNKFSIEYNCYPSIVSGNIYLCSDKKSLMVSDKLILNDYATYVRHPINAMTYGSYSCGLVLTDGKTDNFKICNYITNPSIYGDIYEHNFTFYWDGTGEVWITSPIDRPLHNGYILLTINDTIIMQETCPHSGYIYMIPFIDVDRINITHLCRSINDRTNLNTIVFKHQVYNTSINISELYVTSSSKNLYSIHMTGNQLESVHKTVVETFDIDIPKVPAISTTFGRNGIGEGGDGIVGYNIHDTQYNFMGSRGGSGCVIIELCELIQDPVADFDIYPTVCIQGTEVDFINTSQYYDSCKWDLKDNTTATTVHASHVYNIPGEYQITLTVYKGTKSSSITKTLLIDIDHVIADFDIILDNEKYAPRTISFINTSIGGVAPFTYEWYYKLNDGSWIFIDNTRDISDYLFKRVGIYDIKMVIYNTWSTDTKIVEDAFEIIEPFVSCNFTSDFNNLADNPAPLIVTFYPVTEGLVDTYMWDFGDGTIITVHKNKYDPDKSITHMYDPGDINTTRYYNVSLTVSNSMNSDFVNKIDYIYVTPLMPKPMFIVNEPSRGIRPHNVTFHNMSQYSESYMWDFGDGVTSYDEFPSHTYTEMGEYTVSLTAYNYGKSRTPLYKRSITYTLPKAVIVTGEQLHVLISSK